MYTLERPFADLENLMPAYRYDPGVVVVGCGGTGGFVAEGLCRLLSRRIHIVLIDGDLVERSNLIRQDFLSSELGMPKSQALAERLSVQFQRPIAFGTRFLDEWGGNDILGHGLVVGCVDNSAARQAIAEIIEQAAEAWWIDSGNSDNWGQVLIGNATSEQLGHHFNFDTQKCNGLPLPTIQRPTLLMQEVLEEIDPDCAEAVQAGEQGPTINQAMATLVLEVTRRLIEGTCPWMSLFLDLDSGEMKPTFATPETVGRILKREPEEFIWREAK